MKGTCYQMSPTSWPRASRLLHIIQGIQRAPLQNSQIVKQVLPVVAIFRLAINQRICCFVLQTYRASVVNIPLSSQAAEQLEGPPVLRPDLG